MSDNGVPTIRIHILVDHNPKKAGAAERFAKYREGMTAQEYAEAIGSPAQAYRDMTWDSEQGFIDLVLEGNQTNDNVPEDAGGDAGEARRFG